MKKWFSSPSHRLLLLIPMRKRHLCLPLLEGHSILLVRLVPTLSRTILSRIKQYPVKIKWGKWQALKALFSLALLTWEMRIQEMWELDPFIRQTKGVAAARGLKDLWANTTFNSSSNYSPIKIVIYNPLLFSQEKQQPSWCLPQASLSLWEEWILTILLLRRKLLALETNKILPALWTARVWLLQALKCF